MASPPTTARRKFWGWGLEHEGLDQAELEQLGATFADRFGLDGVRIEEPPRVEELDLRPPRISPPGRSRALHGGSVRARRPQLRQVVPRHRARLPARVSAPSRPRRLPAQRGETSSELLDWCTDASAWLRSPSAAARAWSAASSPTSATSYRGAVSIDLRNLDQVLEVDPRLALGADPGRDARPGARSPAEAARLHAAPLPAVVRVVDARRLDRDPLRRALRDAATRTSTSSSRGCAW